MTKESGVAVIDASPRLGLERPPHAGSGGAPAHLTRIPGCAPLSGASR